MQGIPLTEKLSALRARYINQDTNGQVFIEYPQYRWPGKTDVAGAAGRRRPSRITDIFGFGGQRQTGAHYRVEDAFYRTQPIPYTPSKLCHAI